LIVLLILLCADDITFTSWAILCYGEVKPADMLRSVSQ